MSTEKHKVVEAETLIIVEGNMCGTDKQGEVLTLRRGRRPDHIRKERTGTGEVSGPATGYRADWSASGR